MTPQRFALGIAYQHGRSDLIKAGLDDAVDFITEDELAKAAHAFMANGQPVINLFHSDYVHGVNTDGRATVVESYLHRGPDWVVGDVVVKAGDWLIGAVFDEQTWPLVERGLITGWSPQGTATRRTHRKAIAKSASMAGLDRHLNSLYSRRKPIAKSADMPGLGLVNRHLASLYPQGAQR